MIPEKIKKLIASTCNDDIILAFIQLKALNLHYSIEGSIEGSNDIYNHTTNIEIPSKTWMVVFPERVYYANGTGRLLFFEKSSLYWNIYLRGGYDPHIIYRDE